MTDFRSLNDSLLFCISFAIGFRERSTTAKSGKAFLRPANKYVSLVLRIKDCKNRNFLFIEFVMITSSANCEGFVFFLIRAFSSFFTHFLLQA